MVFYRPNQLQHDTTGGIPILPLELLTHYSILLILLLHPLLVPDITPSSRPLLSNGQVSSETFIVVNYPSGFNHHIMEVEM